MTDNIARLPYTLQEIQNALSQVISRKTSSLPSGTKIQIGHPEETTTYYTAPADGYYYFYTEGIVNSMFYNITKEYSSLNKSERDWAGRHMFPVSAGDQIYLQTQSVYASNMLYFIYAKSSEPQGD